MPRQITFDSDGDAIESSENEIDVKNSDFNKASLSDVESENGELPNDEVTTQPVMNHYDESDDDDDAPEEVSVASSKVHMMDIYKKQKEVAVATRKRKRKQRQIKVEDELDEEMLNLLSNHTSSLSAETTMTKEDEISNKRINLEASSDSTRKVEKKVDGFKLVALPKKTNTLIGKKIDSSILSFQQKHFYGKGTNRVSAATFSNHKKAKITRRSIVCW